MSDNSSSKYQDGELQFLLRKRASELFLASGDQNINLVLSGRSEIVHSALRINCQGVEFADLVYKMRLLIAEKIKSFSINEIQEIQIFCQGTMIYRVTLEEIFAAKSTFSFGEQNDVASQGHAIQ